MALLKRRFDGGYYTVTRLPTGEFVTYQISAVALDQLRDCGLGIGSEIPHEMLLRFREEEWIFTGGSGIYPIPIGKDIPERTIEALIAWGELGRPEDLLDALNEAGISLMSGITTGFVEWVCSFESQLTLSDLIEISYSDFDRYARQSTKTKLSSLHLALLQRENGCWVLWRLTRLAAHVACYPGFPENPPETWSGTAYEAMAGALQRAFEWQNVSHSPARIKSRILLPAIYWKVYDQKVVGVLPAQTLAPGEELRWQVSPGDAFQISVRQFTDKAVVPETHTEPLMPSTWRIEVTHSDQDGNTRSDTVEVCIPSPEGPYVVFDENGKAVPWVPEVLLKPGEYLFLAAPDVETDVLVETEGIDIIEEIDFEPVGWYDWKGFRAQIKAGVVLGGYRFNTSDVAIDWKLEEPPPSPVEFAGPTPIWLERWPRMHIHTADQTIFEHVFLEITSVGANKTRVLPIRPEEDVVEGAVPFYREENGYILDCSRCASLSGLSGSFQARLRLPHQVEKSVSSLLFIVLPGVSFGYCPDSRNPVRATVLEIRSAAEVAPYEACLIVGDSNNGLWTLAATDPVQEPLIQFGLKPEPQSPEILLAVRLRVSRASRLAREDPLGTWQGLPIDIELAKETDLKARLKLELCDRPGLDRNGALFCWLVGGEPVIAGKETAPYTYVISLARWRESFGPEVSGTIQVQCGKAWIPIARLIGPPPAEEKPPGPRQKRASSHSYDPWFQELKRIENLAVWGKTAKVLKNGQHLLVQMRALDCPDIVRTLVQCRLARTFMYIGDDELAGEVLNRLDRTVPDVILASTFLLLRTLFPGNEFLELQGRVERWEYGPQRQLALAEWSYRLGRMGRGGDGTLWEVNREYLKDFIPGSLLDASEGGMLQASTCFLLEESFSPSDIVRQLPWCLNLQKAVEYLRTPLNRWHSGEHSIHQVPWPANVSEPDRIYFDAVLHQAAGDTAGSGDRLGLLANSQLTFPRFDLVLARQASLKGDEEKARKLYSGIMNTDVALEESLILESRR